MRGPCYCVCMFVSCLPHGNESVVELGSRPIVHERRCSRQQRPWSTSRPTSESSSCVDSARTRSSRRPSAGSTVPRARSDSHRPAARPHAAGLDADDDRRDGERSADPRPPAGRSHATRTQNRSTEEQASPGQVFNGPMSIAEQMAFVVIGSSAGLIERSPKLRPAGRAGVRARTGWRKCHTCCECAPALLWRRAARQDRPIPARRTSVFVVASLVAATVALVRARWSSPLRPTTSPPSR